MMKPAGKYFLTWEEAFHSGTQKVGGKGWNLGRLARSGFRIPRGGVLTTQAYNEFISRNRLQDELNNVSRLITADNLLETSTQNSLTVLRQKIESGSIPQLIEDELLALLNSMGLNEIPLAIRSSASSEDSLKASFAGIHESFLNIHGWGNIQAAIKRCYASLWLPQAVGYRRKVNISDAEVTPAVVIMEMVEAQAAGVGFTCDPQTGREDVIVINANFGLGESVVTGAVEPDTYYLDIGQWTALPRLRSRQTGRKEGMTRVRQDGGTEFIKSPELAARQVLPDAKVEQLGLLLLRVFDALGDYKHHQDVEWVFNGLDFVLVQARPVTALPRNTFAALKSQPDIWSNGNFRDALPMVQSPLNCRLMKSFIETDLEASCTEIGYRLPEGLQFSRFFNGRLYCNLAVLQWAWFDSMGVLPRDAKIFWGGHQPEIEIKEQKPLRGLTGLKRVRHLIKAGTKVSRATKNAPTTLAQVVGSIDSLTEKGFRHLEDRDLIKIYNELGRIVSGFAREFWFLSGAATVPVGTLLKNLTKYFGDRAPVVLNALMVGGEADIPSADHGYQLVQLAEIARRDDDAVQFFAPEDLDLLSWKEQLPEGSAFKQAFQDYIKAYGHRAVNELDIINPRWNEDPSYLLDIIRSTIGTADLSKLRAQQKEKSERIWLEIKAQVPRSKHNSIRKLVRQAQSGAAVRENTKSVLARIMEAYRMLAQDIGCRFKQRLIIEQPADIYYCTWPELFAVLTGAWDGVGLRDLIIARKAVQRDLELIAPPDVILGEIPKFTEPVALTSGNYLVGVPVAAGKAAGTARLIHHPGEGSRLEPGDVLVAPATDPGWTPLFLKASAVVMETGGFLSHGAIVAREFGVPAVVNIPGLMKLLKDGCKVVVDGDEGKIIIQ